MALKKKKPVAEESMFITQEVLGPVSRMREAIIQERKQIESAHLLYP